MNRRGFFGGAGRVGAVVAAAPLFRLPLPWRWPWRPHRPVPEWHPEFQPALWNTEALQAQEIHLLLAQPASTTHWSDLHVGGTIRIPRLSNLAVANADESLDDALHATGLDS